MRVRYTTRARRDLDAIFEYIDERAPAATRSVKSALGRSVSRLGTFPSAGPAVDLAGIRELSLTRYPNKIFYRVSKDEVQILHIHDARRRPWIAERV